MLGNVFDLYIVDDHIICFVGAIEEEFCVISLDLIWAKRPQSMDVVPEAMSTIEC